jgi:hypothetical protein
LGAREYRLIETIEIYCAYIIALLAHSYISSPRRIRGKLRKLKCLNVAEEMGKLGGGEHMHVQRRPEEQ